jgi:rubrerythrin
MFFREAPTSSVFPAAIGFFLFQRNLPTDKFTDETEKLEDETTDFSRIRCPLCRWQPRALSRWYCTDAGHPHYFYGGCGTAWNTFDTRGRCPGCNHQWRWTDCLRCGGCSPHEAWYENDPH